MHMSEPHPTKPYQKTGRRLGDAQFAQHPVWKNRNLMALVGMGVEPGFSDVAARYGTQAMDRPLHYDNRADVVAFMSDNLGPGIITIHVARPDVSADREPRAVDARHLLSELESDRLGAGG